MRRMYSEQELTNIIKEVFDAEVESGVFDESIADYVDAYLVEHPVDITALEGQTIEPARINVANINGETNPSVKPIYFHPLTLYTGGSPVTIGEKSFGPIIGSATILNNTSTAISGKLSSIYNYVLDKFTRLNVTMSLYNRTDGKILNVVQLYIIEEHIYCIGVYSDGTRVDESLNTIDLYELLDTLNVIDGSNKIN